jgi:predicted GNAT family N-acyltransferase
MQRVELDAGDAAELQALFAQYGWWDDRNVTEVADALANTPLAVGIRDDGELVAAARVLTDFVYYARIYDVIVAETRRGEGFGEELLSAVLEHADLSEVNPVLICREGLVPFYESVGFEPYPETVDHPDGDDEELHQLYYTGED